MSGTGENENDLRKTLDLTRYASMIVLLLHLYFYHYLFFNSLGWHSDLPDRLLSVLAHTRLFNNTLSSKFLAWLLLAIGVLGARSKKEQTQKLTTIIYLASIGMLLYWLSDLFIPTNNVNQLPVICHIAATSTGYLLILSAGTRISRLIQARITDEVFNDENEAFPQEERLLQSEHSINYSARYQLAGKYRKSYINIINPFRGTIVCGTPGSGKSWFIILPMIKQMIEKGYCLFIYDFKFDDLSKPAYNWMLANMQAYPQKPAFYSIHFDRLTHSHRCNPLDPQSMHDITDATESARTLLLGLNKQWIKRQGDFFIESPINFVTAVIWYLRKYGNGCFCTLPHVIEMMQVQYEGLFAVLNTEPEIQVLLNPFITAYENDAMEQLEGQIASAKISMARLSSPALYWVLSGNDFTLDINNPEHPKIVCVGNNPEKQSIYGAVLSLYISRLTKIVNRKGKLKSALVFDEFPTVFFNSMDSLIATARSNQVATVLCMQDYSQLRQDYGKERADVLINICGNAIAGQVLGDTAKLFSDRFGKIIQKRKSISVNRSDTSVSHSTQLDAAVPASRISTLSSGEFVGMVSDNPNNKIKLKLFHSQIVQDDEQIKQEAMHWQDIPLVTHCTPMEISDNYYQIKQDILHLIEQEVYKIRREDADTPGFI